MGRGCFLVMDRKLYRTRTGAVIESGTDCYRLPPVDWDELLNRKGLVATLTRELEAAVPTAPADELSQGELLAPVQQQGIWAAGVTYFKSRTARMAESKTAGSGSFWINKRT